MPLCYSDDPASDLEAVFETIGDKDAPFKLTDEYIQHPDARAARWRGEVAARLSGLATRSVENSS